MRDTRSLASRLRDRIRIERPVADDSLDGAGSGSWELVQDDIAAEIEDMLPSRGERIANGINITAGPARVRIRYRSDITSTMRVVEILSDDSGNDVDGRILQIVTRPAKLGREALEFVVEEYVPAGNPA
jgi:head-tail adaptor